MAFTIAAVDGWTFTLITKIQPADGAARLDSFELRGECRHGVEILVQGERPLAPGSCGCQPSAAVVAERDRLLADWGAKVGKLVKLR